MDITRPALRYYGGKWRVAPWIISHFPPHESYIEPCGGAASVLLQKPRSSLETYNDIDGRVVNFFRVLRDNPGGLIHQIKWTPWARTEYELSMMESPDPLEDARRFFFSLAMSINAGTSNVSPGMRFVTRDAAKIAELKSDELAEHLYKVAKRFQGVQIECDDYAVVIERYDRPDALTYFDPPYVHNSRSDGDRYAYEWIDEEHERAAAVLRFCEGFVVVSGYACPLYAELFELHQWERRDMLVRTNSGGNAMESLWLSPRTVEALNSFVGLPLFAKAEMI